jgi:hypothetical protein
MTLSTITISILPLSKTTLSTHVTLSLHAYTVLQLGTSSVSIKLIMLNVVRLNVNMLSVVAPVKNQTIFFDEKILRLKQKDYVIMKIVEPTLIVYQYLTMRGKSAASFCRQVAAWFTQTCFVAFLLKNYKIANNSTTAKAREKINTDMESIEF